jgi:hypothetical protein
MVRFFIVFIAALILLVGVVQARDWGPDFSAQMVLTNPKNTSQSQRAEFVSSKGRTRTTSSIPKKRASKQGMGTLQVDIINPYEGAVWRIFPQKGKYYEGRGEAVANLPAPLLPSDSGHPCKTDEKLKCTHSGAENINGRATEKWQIIAPTEDGEVVTTLWFDVELGVPIRELAPGKMMREMTDIKVGPQPDEQFQLPAGLEQLRPAEK